MDLKGKIIEKKGNIRTTFSKLDHSKIFTIYNIDRFLYGFIFIILVSFYTFEDLKWDKTIKSIKLDTINSM